MSKSWLFRSPFSWLLTLVALAFFAAPQLTAQPRIVRSDATCELILGKTVYNKSAFTSVWGTTQWGSTVDYSTLGPMNSDDGNWQWLPPVGFRAHCWREDTYAGTPPYNLLFVKFDEDVLSYTGQVIPAPCKGLGDGNGFEIVPTGPDDGSGGCDDGSGDGTGIGTAGGENGTAGGGSGGSIGGSSECQEYAVAPSACYDLYVDGEYDHSFCC